MTNPYLPEGVTQSDIDRNFGGGTMMETRIPGLKTINAVIREHPEYKNLIEEIAEDIGLESIPDVNAHGIDGGFGSFIYYVDTCKFYQRHKGMILRMAREMADDLGEEMFTMIANFGCLSERGGKSGRHPLYKTDEIAEALYTDGAECADTIQNAMAWFAAEEVCRWFEK